MCLHLGLLSVQQNPFPQVMHCLNDSWVSFFKQSVQLDLWQDMNPWHFRNEEQSLQVSLSHEVQWIILSQLSQFTSPHLAHLYWMGAERATANDILSSLLRNFITFWDALRGRKGPDDDGDQTSLFIEPAIVSSTTEIQYNLLRPISIATLHVLYYLTPNLLLTMALAFGFWSWRYLVKKWLSWNETIIFNIYLWILLS